MLITNYFYIKKCYLNYDKLNIACAAVLISSKAQSSQNKFNEICREYHIMSSRIKNQSNFIDNLRPEDTTKIKEIIGKYEIILLKTLDFNIPENFPYDYINIYSDILYPMNENDIIGVSISICNDSYFTYINNLYEPYIVALCCILLASKFLYLPNFFDNQFKYINKMKQINYQKMSKIEFNSKLLSFSDLNTRNNTPEEDQYFNSLNIYQKIHPYLEKTQVEDCCTKIIEYYEDMKKNIESRNEGNKEPENKEEN
jgi:hypothetical protein